MATIQYAEVDKTELLPIDAQDVVTKVRLVVAGSPAGSSPSDQATNYYEDLSAAVEQPVNYAAKPIVYEYEDPLHATYGSTRSFALPEGIDPFLPPFDEGVPEPTVGNMTNAGSPSAVRDGDPLTYAQSVSPGSLAAIFYAAASGIVGFRIKYHLEADAIAPFAGAVFFSRISDHGTSPVGRIRSNLRFYLSVDVDGADIYSVWPADARSAEVNIAGQLGDTGQVSVQVFPHESFKVYEFYPLILNETLLEDIAKASIRLPASAPQRVTVRGYVAPDREHTIVGWPGGDYTGVVAQHQYELGRTVIDFEQAGSPVGLDADAIETARFQDARVASAIASAGYSLKMGERQ